MRGLVIGLMAGSVFWLILLSMLLHEPLLLVFIVPALLILERAAQ